MARASSPGSTLAQNLEVTGGLKQFRTVAQGSRELDSPFGPPSKPPAREVSPKIEPPAVEPIRAEQRVATKKPQEPRNARRNSEREGEEPTPSLLVENVTVPLSRALRDRSEELARLINRTRTIRKHRITRNSIIRVALQCFLDEFSPAAGEAVNSEEELLQAARRSSRRR